MIANSWILNKYQLSTLPDMWKPSDVILSSFIDNWHLASVIADLLGGYLLRSKLLSSKVDLTAVPYLSAFISLPLIHSVIISEISGMPDITSYGVAFILSQFSDIPIALQQRLLLCFPAGLSLPILHAERTMNNINLLQMALNYAKNTCQ